MDLGIGTANLAGIVAIIGFIWRMQSRMEERLGRIEERLGRIEERLGGLGERVARIEGFMSGQDHGRDAVGQEP